MPIKITAFLLLVTIGTITCMFANSTYFEGVQLQGVDTASNWPYNISQDGLQFWYRGDMGVTQDTSLGTNTVSQWNDISGNGYHATQSTKSFQPVVGTNSFANFTMPGLTFLSAQSKRMNVPSGAASIFSGDDKPFTVIACYHVPSASVSPATVVGFSHISGKGLIQTHSRASGDLRFSKTDDSGATTNINITSIAAGRRVVTWAFSGTQIQGFNNLAAATVRNADYGTTTVDAITIGGFFTNSAFGGAINNDVIEIIGYTRRLSGPEITNAVNDVNSRWTVF